MGTKLDFAALTLAVVGSAYIHYDMGVHRCPHSEGYRAEIYPHITCQIQGKYDYRDLTFHEVASQGLYPMFQVNWGSHQFSLRLGSSTEIDTYRFEVTQSIVDGETFYNLRVSDQLPLTD